jgi:hypothetical protein
MKGYPQNSSGILARLIMILLLAILAISPGGRASARRQALPGGAVYYVDRSHPQANDNNPGTEALPWKTIQHAADVAVAGDTVYVKAGTYPERVQPAHSGSQGQRITFQALPRRSATMWGFFTQGCDFLTIEGFNITTDASLTGWTELYGVFIYSDDVQVIDNYFYNLKSTAITGYWHEPYPQRAYIARNTIYHSQMGLGITGYDWLVEENEVDRLFNYGGGDDDYSRFFGNNHIIRWNHFHGTLFNEIGSAHVDCFQTFDNNGEFVNNVTIEGNLCSEFHQGFMGEGSYYHNITHITFKNNVFMHGLAWGLCVVDIAYLTAINNTFVDIAYHGIGLRGASPNGVVRNNIFSDMETSYWFDDASSIDGDYNLVYHAQEPGQPGPHDQVGADPLFVDPAHDDYHLQASSPAVDAGWGTFAVDQDFDRVHRPQNGAWDIGAFEFLPSLVLSGRPAFQAVDLAWQVNVTPPAGVTWRIDYAPGNGAPPSPVTGIPNAARVYTLQGLYNPTVYSITLTGIDAGTPVFSDTIRVMPGGTITSMPLIYR